MCWMTLFRVDAGVVDVRALVDAGQEAVAPQLRADHRLAGAEDDEAGQVLVLASRGRRVSHEPRLGRIGCVSPEFIISSDGS